MRITFFVPMLVVLALASAMGMGVVGAQEPENSTGPANASGQLEEVEVNGTALEHQEVIHFSEHIRIVGWEIRDGGITVAIDSERRTQVTVTDALAGIGDDGAVRVPETEQWLERHETTIVRMDLTEFQGGASAGVTVDGLTVRLSSEMQEGSNPLLYFGGQSGLFTGMLLSVVLSGCAAGFVLWREESGVMKA